MEMEIKWGNVGIPERGEEVFLLSPSFRCDQQANEEMKFIA